MSNTIMVRLAEIQDVESWMNLIDVVKNKFPGMETDEDIAEYRKTVIQFTKNKSAICAVQDNNVVGVLLFSVEYGLLCFMAVHPDYRRMGIASKMVELMLSYMDRSRDIKVETYREDDPDGEAARGFYKSLGFFEAELTMFEDKYPEQLFILKAKDNC